MTTKQDLIKDLQRLSKENKVITRNFYRANGKFREYEWQRYYPTFTDFVKSAGLNQENEIEKSEKLEKPEINEFVDNKWIITLPKTRINTLDQLLEYAKVDLSVWEVERFIVNKWEVGFKLNDVPHVEPLFQVKAFLRKKIDIVDIKNEIESLRQLACSEARVPEKIEHPVKLFGNMLEINIPDVHFGKLAWPLETGGNPYDLKIALAMYMRALNELVDRVKGYLFDEVIYIIGNDVLNSDDIEGRTTNGTSVSNDSRFHKVFVKVREIHIDAVEKLRKIAPVKVIVVPGNHDTLSAWHLGDSLYCYFHKYEDVYVDYTPNPRKYHQFGKVMLLFTHGDKGKREDYPLLMATEQYKMWGDTQFREAHTGHLHHTKTQEFHGVRVRIVPALCPADDWHSEKCFIGQLRVAEAYVWNKDHGLIAQYYYTDDSQPKLETKSEVIETGG